MDDSQMRILLVEDNADDIALTLRAFNKHNLANDITVARDGAEALDILFDESLPLPVLILLDLKLPKVDGIEVLRRLKNDGRTRRVPVVVLTSSREERDIVESYDLGVNSYIVKPVNFGQFVEAARELHFYWLVFNQPPRT